MHETSLKRRNRVFKSLHKPLTYLGVERTVFYFVCVGAVGVFNLFESLLAGVVVFIGGFIFGRWVTDADPAMLRILAQSERFRTRYDAAVRTHSRETESLNARARCVTVVRADYTNDERSVFDSSIRVSIWENGPQLHLIRFALVVNLPRKLK